MMTRDNYGEGSLYQRTSDWRWFAAIEAGFNRDGSRRRITVSSKGCEGGCKPRCPHRAEIKRRLKLKERQIDRGQTGTSTRTTVKTWSEKWITETVKHVTPNAHTTDLAGVGWIVETIGARTLTQLTPADIRAVRDAITNAGRSTSTALRYHGTLTRMLEAARDEGFDIPANVFTVKPPSAAVHDRTSMTTPEAIAMLEAASQLPHGSRWLAAFLQATRQGETLGLRWALTTDEQLRLAWQKQELPYLVKRDPSAGFRIPDGYESIRLVGRENLVRPKSTAGWRVIPTLPRMTAALDHWRAIAPESPHDLVWSQTDGRPIDEKADREEWYALQDATGVRHPAGRYYYVHEARHTTATLLLSLGVPEDVRIKILGHASIRSSRAYEHPDPNDLRQIRSALVKVGKALELG
jgi:site-specific recombinase XerD